MISRWAGSTGDCSHSEAGDEQQHRGAQQADGLSGAYSKRDSREDAEYEQGGGPTCRPDESMSQDCSGEEERKTPRVAGHLERAVP